MKHFQHPKVKNMNTVSRIVIVPDFQGFGLANLFMENVFELYKDKRITITTSLKPFIKALKNNKKWSCTRFGRISCGKGQIHSKNNANSSYFNSYNRVTASFEWRRDSEGRV